MLFKIKTHWHTCYLFQGVIAEVPEIILRCISRDEAALAVAQKVASICQWFILSSFVAWLLFCTCGFLLVASSAIEVTKFDGRLSYYLIHALVLSWFYYRFSRVYMKMHQTIFMLMLVLQFWLLFVMFASLWLKNSLAGYVFLILLWWCNFHFMAFLFLGGKCM